MSAAINLHHHLVNDFELAPEYSKLLEGYYLLHWSTLYVFKKLSERKDELIEHNNILFVPVFKSESFPLDSNSQLRLSFRIVPDWAYDSGIPNYVLIKAMS